MRYSTGLLGCLLAFSLSASCLGAGYPQSSSASKDKSKPKQKSNDESLGDYYARWLNEDVKYIVTAEEKSVFRSLKTDEEREQFIDQFWKRRDPDPTTAANEFKEEHYRRIQYANDAFAAGIPGWMTDRGRIYVMYGKPDRLETHPIGGPYRRRQEEGGGETSTFPFERWEYRHIEGIGDDIELEFVDYSGGNLYKLSKDPTDKDELLRVPWAGNTDAEDNPLPGQDPAEMRWARISGIRDAGTGKVQGINGEMAKYTPFARMELAANLQKPPVIRFKDLQSDVSARISYNLLPFGVHTSFVRLTGDSDLALLTLEIPRTSIVFESNGTRKVSRLLVYGRVSGLAGNTVFEFDDEIVSDLTSVQHEAEESSSSVYRRPLKLPPGRFKLAVLIKDAVSGRMGSLEQGITAPSFPADRLAASPVIVASELLPVAEKELKQDPYVFGRFRVRPRLDATFRKGEYLGAYFEIYNLPLDPSEARPQPKVEYRVERPNGEIVLPYRDVSRSAVPERDMVVLPLYVDLSALTPGQYVIAFRVSDPVQHQVTESRAQFVVGS
jgi:GWxTD domain-containing protein